jgi:uncharacterized membrane protein YphA (DoxX/SURF4 family)
MDKRLNSAWWTLRIGIGAVAAVAGLDKFFNLLADWPSYVSPLFARLIPFSPQVFMYLVGIIEMVVGLAILTKWTRIGAYVAMVWLLGIAFNLITSGNYLDVAARDVVMSLAAFTLAKLSEVREGVPLRAERERAERAPGHRQAPVSP